MESVESMEENVSAEKAVNDVIQSKTIRAGQRTYFFDVKSTRYGEYYLTITESKKKYDADGGFHYEKHKLFLYPEDFEKFCTGMQEMIDFIEETSFE
ncbi:MAG: DUF3276 family protein [Mariniphaga sp.]|nr:DUF3276 family protein [Mariniphaga sp.]MDD4226998.1 DUF3276 family protein [Mariniphaga sp.]